MPDDAVILGPNKFGRAIDANVCADRARASAEVIAASANRRCSSCCATAFTRRMTISATIPSSCLSASLSEHEDRRHRRVGSHRIGADPGAADLFRWRRDRDDR